jgi:hypothetical protein
VRFREFTEFTVVRIKENIRFPRRQRLSIEQNQWPNPVRRITEEPRSKGRYLATVWPSGGIGMEES